MTSRALPLLLIAPFLILAPSCSRPEVEGGGATQAESGDSLTLAGRLREMVGVLAADSMEGRLTGTRGAVMAADFIALKLESLGLEPAFPTGFLQPVPLARVRDAQGRERLVLAEEGALEDLDVVETLADVNVGALFRGLDPVRSEEAVVVGAHFDHLGIRAPAPGTAAEAEGDSIFNGADDDASGVAAVLEIARDFALQGPADRTIVFLLTTGEEMGMLGTRWYVAHPAVPLDRTVADLQVEMIGRPDSLAGGYGKAWLTGFERSTVGEELASGGLSIVPDPRPEGRFFFRSDNIAFAREGIPAHTVSTYDMYDDYHTPEDEVGKIDFSHMAAVVESLGAGVRLLADGPTPRWNEGGRPEGS